MHGGVNPVDALPEGEWSFLGASGAVFGERLTVESKDADVGDGGDSKVGVEGFFEREVVVSGVDDGQADGECGCGEFGGVGGVERVGEKLDAVCGGCLGGGEFVGDGEVSLCVFSGGQVCPFAESCEPVGGE